MIPPSPAAPLGFSERARHLAGQILRLAGARWQLIALEARQARGHGVKLLLISLVALLATALTYLLTLFVVILWAARTWAQGDVLMPLAVAALLHLLVAIAAIVWLTRRGSTHAFFTATRAEFAQDQLWLHSTLRK
jgi:uncharacterized membrane protein YqjE